MNISDYEWKIGNRDETSIMTCIEMFENVSQAPVGKWESGKRKIAKGVDIWIFLYRAIDYVATAYKVEWFLGLQWKCNQTEEKKVNQLSQGLKDLGKFDYIIYTDNRYVV